MEEVPLPDIGPDDVLVRVRASGICGSDVHRYLGTEYGRTWPYPMNSGHEYCGDVAQVGSAVTRFREGDRATLGVAWPQGHLGAFSEFVFIPDADRRLVKLSKDIPHVAAAVIEPLTVGLMGCLGPDPTPDDNVVILGAGPIGLCVLLVCKSRGLENVIVSDPSPKRRELADSIGATVVNPAVDDLKEIVKDTTGGRGADVIFECAGATVTLSQAFALIGRDGRISLLAHYSSTPAFDVELLRHGSWTAFRPTNTRPFYDGAVELVSEGKVDLAQIVSHQFPLEKAVEAFEVACDANASAKVLFVP